MGGPPSPCATPYQMSICPMRPVLALCMGMDNSMFFLIVPMSSR